MQRWTPLLLLCVACAPPAPPMPAPERAVLTSVVHYWFTRDQDRVGRPPGVDTAFWNSSVSFNAAPDSAIASSTLPVAIWHLAEDRQAADVASNDLGSLDDAYTQANANPVRFVTPLSVPGLTLSLTSTRQPVPGSMILYLSRPGMNAAGDSAIVHVVDTIGTSAQGAVLLMVWLLDRWKVAAVLAMEFS